MVEQLQRHYTPEEFAAVDAKIAGRENAEIPPDMRDAIAECAK
jgi:hypothetical protein